jgi:hypothetical protein
MIKFKSPKKNTPDEIEVLETIETYEDGSKLCVVLTGDMVSKCLLNEDNEFLLFKVCESNDEFLSIKATGKTKIMISLNNTKDFLVSFQNNQPVITEFSEIP